MIISSLSHLCFHHVISLPAQLNFWVWPNSIYIDHKGNYDLSVVCRFNHFYLITHRLDSKTKASMANVGANWPQRRSHWSIEWWSLWQTSIISTSVLQHWGLWLKSGHYLHGVCIFSLRTPISSCSPKTCSLVNWLLSKSTLFCVFGAHLVCMSGRVLRL